MEIQTPHHSYSTMSPVCLNIWRPPFWQTALIFAPKRIRGLSSVDSKQGIIEIGCHCYNSNCLRCHLVPNRDGKTMLFPHYTFCVCRYKRRRKRNRKRKSHVVKFVELVECASLWSLTFSHQNFPHLVSFQMFMLTASILADEKPLEGNEIFNITE